MKINDFIVQGIAQIKNAVDTVNKSEQHIGARMPETVRFEISTNQNGDVEDHGDHHVIMDINTWEYCNHEVGVCHRNTNK